MKNIKFIIGLMPLLLIALNIFAEPVGTLTLDKGIIKLRRNQIDNIYKESGMTVPVENLDEIQTGQDTRVNIHFDTGGDDIELFSSTFFTVNHVEPESSEFSMPAGKSRFVVKKLPATGKVRRFRLRTTNALIGVKGTEFVVGVLAGTTNLLTLSGLVSLASIATPEVAVEVKQNQASKLQENRPPTMPVEVPPQVRENIISSDSATEFETIDFGTEIETSGAPAAAGTEESAIEEIQDPDEIIADVGDALEEVEETIDEATQTTDTAKSIEFTIVDE